MIKVFTDINLINIHTKEPLFPLFDEFILNENTLLKNLYTFIEDVSICDVLILPVCIDYLLEHQNKKKVDEYFKLAKNK